MYAKQMRWWFVAPERGDHRDTFCVIEKPQGSKVTVIEVDGKALMLSGKLSLSRRAINGGTCGHPCVAWQIFTGPSRRRTG